MTITFDARRWRASRGGARRRHGPAAGPARADNPSYYDILRVRARSGLPALINTSFNMHEEPIVNAPAECVKALVDGRVDFVVTDRGLYVRGAPG